MGKPLWDRSADEGWQLLVNLVPADKGVVPQYPIPISEGWALTQGRDNATGSNATDDLILTRFTASGERKETRTVLRGGHGDRAYSVDGYLVTLVKNVWSRVRFGSPWSWLQVTAPARCVLLAGVGCQGETRLPDGRWLRLYGESIKGGSERDPAHRTPFLQVIDGASVVDKIDLSRVALDSKGLPIGGRYEPEGVIQTVIDGEDWTLVGFAVGRLGNTTMNVYGRRTRDVLNS